MSPSVQKVEPNTGLYKINRISDEKPATLTAMENAMLWCN